MRFIVELYRLLILGGLAVSLTGASYLVFELIQTPETGTGTPAYVTFGLLIGAAIVIVSLGLTATFISMHDRLEEIADAARSISQSAMNEDELLLTERDARRG